MSSHDPTERAWNSTLPKGKGFQPKPSWKGYKAGNSLADSDGRPSKIAQRQTKPKGRRRINPVSAKTAARNREYAAEKAAHRAANPYCEFKDPDNGRACGKIGDDTHHVESRGVAPDRVTDRSNFVTLCRPHHDDWLTLRASGLVESSSYELRLQHRRRIEQGEVL